MKRLLALLLLASFFVMPTGHPINAAPAADQPIRIQYLGVCSFLITAPDGTRILTDPFNEAPYSFPRGVEADVVTVSHNHSEHNNVKAVSGDPIVINEVGSQQVGMVQITGYPATHGKPSSSDIVIYAFQIGDVKIVHLSMTSPEIDPVVIEAIKDADIVTIPLGALDLDDVFPLMDQLQARTMLPTYYSEPDTTFDYNGAPKLDEFLAVVPAETPVVKDQTDLTVTPGMPTQVVTMTRSDLDALTPAPAEEAQASDQAVQIQYLGISSFLITAPDGTRIITDPFSGAPYSFPKGIEADVVTISHGHSDHNYVQGVGGDPIKVLDDTPQQVGMVQITGYKSQHGGDYGGTVYIYVFQIGDVKIVHLGAPNVSKLETEVLDAISDADVVLLPMLSISLEEAFPFMEQIHAWTIIPMHYSDDAAMRFYGAPSLDEFLAVVPMGYPVVRDQAELTVQPRTLQIVTMTRFEPED